MSSQYIRDYQKARNARIRASRPIRFCKKCNKPIPSSKNSSAIWCSKACSRKNYKRRRHSDNVLFRSLVVELLGSKCCICSSIRFLEVDHIIPFFLGGTNCLKNVQLLCKVCHMKKSKKEFVANSALAMASPHTKENSVLAPTLCSKLFQVI